MKKPFASVILVSWNRKKDILETLEDLKYQTYKSFQIIIVDQNSDEGTSDEIAKLFPDVRIVKMKKHRRLWRTKCLHKKFYGGNSVLFAHSEKLTDWILYIVYTWC